MFHRYLDGLEEEVYNDILVPLIKKRGRQPPSYSDVRRNISLVLGNSHVSTGVATSLPQNYKSVGGYHIHGDVEPLPKVIL